MTAAGSIFGRNVVSTVPLLFTRDPLDADGSGSTLCVEVADSVQPGSDDELLISWVQSSQNPLTAAVHRSRHDDDRYLITIGESGTFVVRPRAGELMMPSAVGDRVRREARLWSLPAMLCLIAQGELPLHAAAIERGGRAVVVGGLSRAGKSTLAAAAVREGWRLLSEDTTAIRLDERIQVLPGAASLRLRPDVATEVMVRDASRWTMPDGRVQHALHRDSRGSAAPVPLAATVLLAWGDGPAGLEPVTGAEALRDLWSLTFRIPETQDRLRCFDQLATLTSGIPTHRLHRPRDLDALAPTLSLLAELVGG